MDKSYLQRCISLYGADLANWPDDVRQLIENDDRLMSLLRIMIAEELEFEQLLLSSRFEPHDPQLAQSIIKSSLPAETDQQSGSVTELFYRFAKPALSLAATLVVGLVLGYNLPTGSYSGADDNIDDYSQLLYDQDDIL